METTETLNPRSNRLDVVVIDDEVMFTEGCRQTLEMGGYRAAVAQDGPQGLQLVRSVQPSVVLIDLKMPGMDGLEVLGHLNDIEPSIVPIMVTGHGTVDSAVESMKIGAFDFLTKPFEPEKLLETVRRGMNLHVLRKEARESESIAVESGSAELSKYDLLLRGLDMLGEAYSLGLEKRQLLDELSYLEAEAKYHAESLGQIKRKERAILDTREELMADVSGEIAVDSEIKPFEDVADGAGVDLPVLQSLAQQFVSPLSGSAGNAAAMSVLEKSSPLNSRVVPSALAQP